MKINISSKTLSLIIAALIFTAIGIFSIVLISKSEFSDVEYISQTENGEYSEHEGWTNVSEMTDVGFSQDISIESLNDKINYVNSLYSCGETLTDKQFSDEVGIKISEISFLRDYTPADVNYSYGYIYAGDKVYDNRGNDITLIVEGYNLADGRDKNGNVLFEKNGKYYYLSENSMVEAQNVSTLFNGPSYVTDFDNELSLFESNGKWGAKDSQGEIVVKALYTHAYGFKEGVCCFASKSNTLYIYTENGVLISSKYVLPQNGLGSKTFQNGITLVSDGEKNLVMKSNGAILDLPDDFQVLGCSDGVVLLKKNGRFGYIDNTGRWIYNPDLVSASYFSEGLSVVSDGEVFVIDKSGNEIIPKGFDYISDFSDGIAIMYSDKYGWYSAQKLELK